MKTRISICLALAAGLCAPLPGQAADAAPAKKPAQAAAKAPGPREALKQYLADLQKSPGDRALREKIVSLAAGMKPRPETPQEARKPFFKAATFFKEAKDASGLELAIRSYKEALLLAPWWPEANYNLAQAQEAAGQYAEAIEALKLYLLTKPKAEDAEEAEQRLYSLEAKMELAQKEKEKRAREDAAAAAAKAEEERTFAGEWCQSTPASPDACIANEYRRMTITGSDSAGYRVSFACRQAGCVPPGWVDSVSVSGKTISFRVGEKWALLIHGEDGSTVNVHNKFALTLSAENSRLSGSQEAVRIGSSEWLSRGGDTWARVR